MINKLNPGDRQISASGWNEIRERVNNIAPGQNTILTGSNNATLITVKNSTGSNLTPLSVVAVSTPIYSRSGSTFADKAVEFGTEMTGISPANEKDNIAVIQAACKTDGIVKAIGSGYTPCFIYKDENKSYEYAKPIANQTGYLRGTNDPTGIRVVWLASGTGRKEAVVCIDAAAVKPEKEYFVINKGNDGTSPARHTPTIFTKGSLHYVTYDGDDWVPSSWNEASSSSTQLSRPSGTKLVVCQEDAPDSSKEYKMPYYTPEMNLGVPPLLTNYYQSAGAGCRCGVKPGEHTFTKKCLDYSVNWLSNEGITLCYEPRFTDAVFTAQNPDGTQPVGVEIDGNVYDCFFPTDYAGLSGPSYPDIYEGDNILVEFDCDTYTAWAIDYSKDYPEHTILPWYTSRFPSMDESYRVPFLPGRGWQKYNPYQDAWTDSIAVEYIDARNRHLQNDQMWVEKGENEKVAVNKGCLIWIEKVKTNALL